MMPGVSVDSLQPGMILAKPLSKGTMVIMGEGTVLSEALISRIAGMGIERIFIDGPSEQPIPIEEALAALDARFRGVLDKPHMSEIKKIVKEHIEGLYV
ncbi:MAG: hypothetical protein NTZ24_03565 [Deltaproteobacteria bacterium]|nr:hypothetical protein [Deltaproteobacteria bacterium]